MYNPEHEHMAKIAYEVVNKLGQLNEFLCKLYYDEFEMFEKKKDELIQFEQNSNIDTSTL